MSWVSLCNYHGSVNLRGELSECEGSLGISCSESVLEQSHSVLTAVLYARAGENVVEVGEEHLLPCGFNGFGVNLCACSCVSECNCGFSFGERAFSVSTELCSSRGR